MPPASNPLNPSPVTRPGQRWLAADPLLPALLTARGCGAELTKPGPGGEPAAACEHWRGTPGDLETTFGAAAQFQLTIQMAAPQAGTDALDRLLSAWRDHLADVPEAGAEDSAAIIAFPSRDISGPVSLLRRGFTCRKVIAARPAGRPGYPPPATGTETGIKVRRACPADLDTVTRLGMEVIRFDAHFGTLAERPDTAEALRRDAAAGLAAPDPWIWLAERDGTPAGLLYARPPEQARWAAPLVRLAPAAYVEFMYVEAAERGRGAGPALAERLHREARAAGVAVTLLHYELLNPLSGPFWTRQGYRPLWNIWETRPARAIR
jgi:GNAT superfamily N-acetyltransferase